jgi:hypothetical protein
MYNIINEGSLSLVSVDEAINKKYVQLVLTDSYNDEELRYAYASEEGIDEDDIIEEDYERWVKYELNYAGNEFIELMEKDYIKSGEITIWREMTVDDTWESSLGSHAKHLGIYWTYDRNAAEAHWGHNNNKMTFHALIEAKVKETSVNWLPTIRLNTEPKARDEKEIRLVKSVPLEIVAIYIDDKEIDISELADKRFIA